MDQISGKPRGTTPNLLSVHTMGVSLYPMLYGLHGFSIGTEQWRHEIRAPQTIEGAKAIIHVRRTSFRNFSRIYPIVSSLRCPE